MCCLLPPLLADIIIALDASADSQDQWFTRASEYAKQYAAADSPPRWPQVNVEALFPSSSDAAAATLVTPPPPPTGADDSAAAKVDEAKQQEALSGGSASGKKKGEERKGVRTDNPEPTPLGSAPESREHAAREAAARAAEQEGDGKDDGEKPMPVSAAGEEPPLGKCRFVLFSSFSPPFLAHQPFPPSLTPTLLPPAQYLDRFNLPLPLLHLPFRPPHSRNRSGARRDRAGIHPPEGGRAVPGPVGGVFDVEV